MARSTRSGKGGESEETTPDVSVLTDVNAEATDETAKDSGAEDEGAADASGSSDDDGAVKTDGGTVLVEVAADGIVVRVGKHPLMLSRGQRARVTEDVADRGEQRKSLRRV